MFALQDRFGFECVRRFRPYATYWLMNSFTRVGRGGGGNTGLLIL